MPKRLFLSYYQEETTMRRNRYTVQDAADLVGLGPWTLRRLERLGRIPTPPRDSISGWRYYSDDDVERLREALGRIADKRTLAVSA